MEKDSTTIIITKPQRKHAGTSRNMREKDEETVLNAKNVLAHAASAKEPLYELKRKEIEEYVSNLRHKGHHSLATEVEQSFRKISDCLGEFEDSLSRHKTAFTTNQREKLEMDFKREMKRIQRQRDQIKQWLNDTSIKDKTMLEEMKLIIETQMERYKQIERDCKAREYSDYSLNVSKPLTPLEQEEQKTRCWLDKSIVALQSQVDKIELEIGKIVDAKKRKSDWQQQRAMNEHKTSIKKHTSHITKLEIIKRILTNFVNDTDELTSFLPKVAAIMEDIDYYIQSSNEPEYEENEHLYDDIDEVERACFNGNLSLKAPALVPLPAEEKETNAISPLKNSETEANNKDASVTIQSGQPQLASKHPAVHSPNTSEKKTILTVAIRNPSSNVEELSPSMSKTTPTSATAKEKDPVVTEGVSPWKTKELPLHMSAWPQLTPQPQLPSKPVLQPISQNLANMQERIEPDSKSNTPSVQVQSWKDKLCSSIMVTQPRPMRPQVLHSIPRLPLASSSLHQLTEDRQRVPVVTTAVSPWTNRESFFNIPAAWQRVLRPQLTEPAPKSLTLSSSSLNYLTNSKEPVTRTVTSWKDKDSFFSMSALPPSSRIGRPQSIESTSKPPTLSKLNYLANKEKEPVVTRTVAPWKGKDSFFSAPTSPRLTMKPLERPPPTAPAGLHHLMRERERQLVKPVPSRHDMRFYRPNGLRSSSSLRPEPQLPQTPPKSFIPAIFYLPAARESASVITRGTTYSRDIIFSDRATSHLKLHQKQTPPTSPRLNYLTVNENNDTVRRKVARSKDKEPCFRIPKRSRAMRPLTKTDKPAVSVKSRQRREKAARYVDRFRPRRHGTRVSILFFPPAFPPLLEALEAAVLLSEKSVEKVGKPPASNRSSPSPPDSFYYSDALFNIPGFDGPLRKMNEIIEEELLTVYGEGLSKSFGRVDSLDSDCADYAGSNSRSISNSTWAYCGYWSY